MTEARLTFERNGERTVLREAYARTPLKLLTPRNHGHAAWAYLSSHGAGLVDGDQVSLALELAPGATGFVSTQGPGRVYRNVRGCAQSLRARVSAGAVLAYLPEPLACFASARLAQTSELEVEQGGSLAYLDVLTAGRVAREERWAMTSLASTLVLRHAGRRLLAETLRLAPEHGALERRMGGFNAVATLLLVGPAWEAARQRALALRGLVRPGAEYVESASLIGDEAVLLRAAGHRVETVVERLRVHFRELPSLLGDDPFARRADATVQGVVACA